MISSAKTLIAEHFYVAVADELVVEIGLIDPSTGQVDSIFVLSETKICWVTKTAAKMFGQCKSDAASGKK
jgi:hypothetical protein